MDFIVTKVMELAAQYPTVATILMIVGVLRAIFKPIMSVVDAYVDSTPSQTDNAKWLAIKESKVFKAISWLFDYFASLKFTTLAPK